MIVSYYAIHYSRVLKRSGTFEKSKKFFKIRQIWVRKTIRVENHVLEVEIRMSVIAMHRTLMRCTLPYGIQLYPPRSCKHLACVYTLCTLLCTLCTLYDFFVCTLCTLCTPAAVHQPDHQPIFWRLKIGGWNGGWKSSVTVELGKTKLGTFRRYLSAKS